MRQHRWTFLCLSFASLLCAGVVHATESTYQRFEGLAGYGLAGVGGETPPEQYYLELDTPYVAEGQSWDRLLTAHELPQDARVTVCGRVEIRTFDGIEQHFNYAVLAEIVGPENCH